MSTEGKLLCSYPGPAVQIPSDIFSEEFFLGELAHFLVQMNVDVVASHDAHETAHPKHISELLVGILRGFGHPATVDRITKRIGDEALCRDAYKPWRRSPLWLIIRVVLQTSLDANTYKTFILLVHARLLKTCAEKNNQSETLYVMRTKTARRLSKMGTAVPDDVYEAVYDAAAETETRLQRRWLAFQASQSVSPPWNPAELDVLRDTTCTLNNSRPYLLNALQSLTTTSDLPNSFSPIHPPRLANTLDLGQLSGGQLAAAVTADKRIALADFELSIEKHLDNWVEYFQHDDSALDMVASCIEKYFELAKDIYGGDPKDNSVMVLTIMDLWMALDKLATRQCPLLKSYSPEIPQDFLHPLLLHRSGSLNRAMLVEEYLLQRHNQACHKTPIFSDDPAESSFAVQYFRASQRLQRLHVEITQHATEERNRKRAELETLNARWQALKDAASGMSHTCIWDKKGKLISGGCQKCQTEDKAKDLTVDIHEWPLPQDALQAQVVVFELTLPRAFSTWREITYKILCDISMPNLFDHSSDPSTVKVDKARVFLDSFVGLSDWAIRHSYHRITIGSTTLPFRHRPHYGAMRIPTDESKVLLDSGLIFRLYDRKAKSWVEGPISKSSIANVCSPPIHVTSPYAKMFSFVSGTQHTSNEVIAAQADCPPELSPHEYMAFSSLRSGPRLQWLNIARELSSPSLSFRREEVYTLIAQAAWQIGPLSDGVREWHIDLGLLGFGSTLLQELEVLLERIEANWQEEVTVRTIGMSNSTLPFPLRSAQYR